MEYRRFGSDCVIRIQKGEEILAALRQVCTQENIVLASVNGIGAVNDVTLGVFNSKKFVYESTRYTGDMEIVSCMGNVTQKDGEVTCTCTWPLPTQRKAWSTLATSTMRRSA